MRKDKLVCGLLSPGVLTPVSVLYSGIPSPRFFSVPHFFAIPRAFFFWKEVQTHRPSADWKPGYRAELEQMKNMKAKTMKTLHSLIASIRAANLILTQRVTFPLLVLGAGLALVQPCMSAPFQFEETGSLNTGRASHSATLLPNGKILVAGGADGSGVALASAELYDSANGSWTATGSLITGRASGNTQDSSSNYPIVQLRSLDSSQVFFLPVNPVGGWSDTSFTSRPVRDFPFGPALVTVFTNGIPSTAKYLVVTHDR
jgi:hypothetical protein